MQKKRLFIELVILSLVILLIIGYLNLFWVKKQVANYYYSQATESLEKKGIKKSTNYLIQAIHWDPELNSQEYKKYKEYRNEFMAN